MVRADTTAVQRSEVQDKGGRSYAHHQGRNGEQGGGDTQHRQLPPVKLHPHSEVLLPQGEQRQGGGSQPKSPALYQRQLWC